MDDPPRPTTLSLDRNKVHSEAQPRIGPALLVTVCRAYEIVTIFDPEARRDMPCDWQLVGSVEGMATWRRWRMAAQKLTPAGDRGQ